MTRRKIDMAAEQELSKFLDYYFYLWMEQDYKYSISRKSDKKFQLEGVDVVIQTKSKKFNVDEKAQLYYINKELPTFAFEVNFINQRGELAGGWLLNNDLLTDYYLLIWPCAKHENLNFIKTEDFTELDCLMIEKKKIQNYLISKGWTSKKIHEKAQELRNGTRYGKIKIENENNFYFYYSESKSFSEQPINIVIRKNILIELADQRYKVSKNNVIKGKLHS